MNKNKTRYLIFITSQTISKNTLLVLPRNSGLQKYREQLESLPNKKIIVRAEDVPLFVELLKEKEIDCVGLTGEDLFLEYKLNNKRTNLKIKDKIEWIDNTTLFGKPALCLLGKKETNISSATIAINKKYKAISNKYFKNKQTPLNKIYFSGSTERAFDTKIANCIIDIVYSGSSAKESGLEILDVLKKSDVVVIE